MLQFRYGGTRFVVLTNRYAIKFARFRPFRVIQRFLELRRQGRVGEQLKTYNRNRFVGSLKYLCAGVQSNLQEYRLCREYPELPLAYTLFTLCGFVNVQRRGSSVTEDELAKAQPFHPHPLSAFFDMGVHNFARIGNEVRLIDYGYYELPKQFAQLASARS